MCELLGINSQQGFDTTALLSDFFKRGGETGDHSDGWGVASFDEFNELQLTKYQSAAAVCPYAQQVLQQRPYANRLIAHIRKATFGEPSLKNTQPFRRSVWGGDWVFAHNGDLYDFHPESSIQYPALGHTDSERAFCSLLTKLFAKFDLFHPKLTSLLQFLQQQSDEIARYGNFNYLLGTHQLLIAYASSELYWSHIKQPQRAINLVDSQQIVRSLSSDQSNSTIIVATKPLTSGEVWYPMGKGEIRVFSQGQPVLALAGVRQYRQPKQGALMLI